MNYFSVCSYVLGLIFLATPHGMMSMGAEKLKTEDIVAIAHAEQAVEDFLAIRISYRSSKTRTNPEPALSFRRKERAARHSRKRAEKIRQRMAELHVARDKYQQIIQERTVKSAEKSHHLADLKEALEEMLDGWRSDDSDSSDSSDE